MNNQESQSFHYTYCAAQQEEIKAIREKYAPTPKAEDKLTRLRKLDDSVTQKATMLSLICGILGALILGSGMSLILTQLYESMNLSRTASMAVGIVLGIAGIVLVCAAYPLYNRTLRRQREKIAPEILRLTEELMQ